MVMVGWHGDRSVVVVITKIYGKKINFAVWY